MHELHWIARYATYATDSVVGEKELIAWQPLYESEVASFTATSNKPSKGLAKISRAQLQDAYGTCDLVRVLQVLARVDGAVSRAASLLSTPIMIHHAIYGQDEYAHAPVNYLPNSAFISLNIGQPRVRALLIGVLRKNAIAFCAMTDLLVHEKAHLALPGTRGHGSDFYEKKRALKELFCEALQVGLEPDPFHRVRCAGPWLPSADDLMLKFPEKVSPIIEEVKPN